MKIKKSSDSVFFDIFMSKNGLLAMRKKIVYLLRVELGHPACQKGCPRQLQDPISCYSR